MGWVLWVEGGGELGWRQGGTRRERGEVVVRGKSERDEDLKANTGGERRRGRKE